MDEIFISLDDVKLYTAITEEGTELYTSQDGTLAIYVYELDYYLLNIHDGYLTVSIIDIDSFIDANTNLIYDKYVSVHPEEVHSDWTLEDAHNLEDFITKYMLSELIIFAKGE